MEPVKDFYFSGIAGSGMSGIALFMAERGFNVRGSDRLFDVNNSHRLLNLMRSLGIEIVPQDGSGIDSKVREAVFSTAVEENNPDYLKAKRLNIPVKTRPEFLAGLVAKFRTIAVAGTSGKSTVSGMLAFIMKELGLEPSFIGGGRVIQFRSQTNQGNYLSGKSDCLVIEACESDGSIVNYYPESTVILNLDLDHHSIEETREMFRQLTQHTSKHIIINGDDGNLKELISKDFCVFAIDEQADFKAESIIYGNLNSSFTVRGVDFKLSLPGRYNVYNALSCIAYLLLYGIDPKDISAVLPKFQGIERRFQIHLNDNRGLVIDDYAHNPHKISSMMKAASALAESILYIFQPHGYGPTRLMKEGYINAFVKGLRERDHLMVLPIYYAGGTTSKDVSSNDIVDGVLKGSRSAEVISSRDEIFNRIGKFKHFVVFGARDDSLSDLAEAISNALK